MVQRMTPIERAHSFGGQQRLVGIVTEPAQVQSPQQRPMVVILNSGIIHRVGPNRLGVLLAREIAVEGCRVLRFDLSGIGDSEMRPDALPPLEAAFADIREALDWAEGHLGCRSFVLVGLCSGADHAVLYSGGDPRVVGAVIMDPTVPPTAKFRWRRWIRRVTNLELWRRVFTGEASAWQRVLARPGAAEARRSRRGGPDLGSAEVRRYLEDAYRRALADSRELLAVFTDGMPSQHNYAEQLRDALPAVDFSSRCRIAYLHGADHTFSDESQRDKLLALVRSWVREAHLKLIPGVVLAACLSAEVLDLAFA
ncbi:alpha/beta fold hydrolase [Piscinibacter aquaticus]|uniref:Alpha/beta fold hydrolase n=1 Tax=Piscinibacter aquaticus TaxID=392597 RepID=A0A5C6U2Y3_9BURK|nr:alpha/beta fold hydrolase [Piscinibacter aquaticus]